jgi:hypothetical protein
MTFGEKVIQFNQSLHFNGELPQGISIMNPFSNIHVKKITTQFYTRFYADSLKRIAILGINPGRFGAGATGIPFTDTVRLNQYCGINFDDFKTYEPSSAFIYEMIRAYGGAELFFRRYYFSAVCPLGFTKKNEKGRDVNYNYYDSRALTDAAYEFIVDTIKAQLSMGIDTEKCYCLGTGKNDAFLRKLNDRYGLFKSIVTLEHPRYIMQYKARMKEAYIMKYLMQLNSDR